MNRFYRALIHLYPRHIRDEFGDEMLAVFEAASLDGGGVFFLLRECGGVIGAVIRERAYLPPAAPALAGLLVACLLNGALYTTLASLLARPQQAFTLDTPQGQQIELGSMALAALAFVVPLIVLLSRNIQSSLARTRQRSTR
jgi:hypothetical protein